MRLLKTAFHPDVSPEDVAPASALTLLVRHTARGIVLKGECILLLYTQRYHDYSLPGGGLDEGEDNIAGLIRELQEETGAQGVCNVKAFARYDEYRPWHKPDADIIHIISHCYVCEIDETLGETAFEPHEVSNGMTPLWMNIHEAIAHNEAVIANSEKKGLSIERETFLLSKIAETLVAKHPVNTTNPLFEALPVSFSTLGLCDALLNTVAAQGYITPSPIQVEAIPMVLSQRDVMAVAHTGTGKTAGFTLPIIQRLSGGASAQANRVRALIITPTRELAAQVAQSVQDYSQGMNIRSAAVYGGVRIEYQRSQLQGGLDVLVATPGRLLDLHGQQAIDFDQLEILVLDEADRMLDLGFIEDVRHIQQRLPAKRQTLMFSATFSKAIKALAKGMLNDPVFIEVDTANSTVDKIVQKVHPVDQARKSEVLIHLLKTNDWPQVLVFTRTKRGADSVVVELGNAGIRAESIHSNRTQHARTRALDGFRDGSIAVLVATDIAARGIDINQLSCVINLELPYVAEDYVHRIGRTGRGGTDGVAISLFSEDESKQLKSIERVIGRQFKREIIPGFEPTKQAPAHPLDDEEYGNFEADSTPKRRGRSRGRGGKSSGRKRK